MKKLMILICILFLLATTVLAGRDMCGKYTRKYLTYTIKEDHYCSDTSYNERACSRYSDKVIKYEELLSTCGPPDNPL